MSARNRRQLETHPNPRNPSSFFFVAETLETRLCCGVSGSISMEGIDGLLVRGALVIPEHYLSQYLAIEAKLKKYQSPLPATPIRWRPVAYAWCGLWPMACRLYRLSPIAYHLWPITYSLSPIKPITDGLYISYGLCMMHGLYIPYN